MNPTTIILGTDTTVTTATTTTTTITKATAKPATKATIAAKATTVAQATQPVIPTSTTTKISLSVVLVIILFILIKIADKLSGLLKDQSTATNKPYSLSRTLLCLWTVVILFALFYIGFVEQALPKITNSILLLLGIAAGTALVGGTVDRIQSADKSLIRIQDSNTGGFLNDLLTDANGVSISRFQTLFFNLLYAAIFIAVVITKKQFYDFDGDKLALTLLGVSSVAYAALKIPEAKSK